MAKDPDAKTTRKLRVRRVLVVRSKLPGRLTKGGAAAEFAHLARLGSLLPEAAFRRALQRFGGRTPMVLRLLLLWRLKLSLRRVARAGLLAPDQPATPPEPDPPVTPEERVIALEQELTDTRQAAVQVILDMANTVITTQQGREHLARSFDEAAVRWPGAKARLARLVAAALRR